MDRMPEIDKALEKVQMDIEQFFRIVRGHLPSEIETLDAGLSAMRRIRLDVYENLNQIQHESLLVRAREQLEAHEPRLSKARWFWNPRQTGDDSEPDLRALIGGRIVVSGEATTSEAPKGVIDTRMRNTLAALAEMQGQRYYFVRTPAMKKRAETKCRKAGWRISVCELPV